MAELYDQVRPVYPDDALDALVALGGLPRRGRVLEVGAGTGQLTVPLAERGYHITAVEIGVHLAERLRRNTSDYGNVEVLCARHAPRLLGAGTSASSWKQAEWRTEIDATGRFGDVQVRSHPWSVSYSRDTYLQLLSTYSDHILLEPAAGDALFADLGALIDRGFRGTVEKHYDALVVVAPVLPAGVS